MRELLIKILDFLGLACWTEIITEYPKCTYYFGPFLDKQEATQAKPGYIEDLENEGAKGIKVAIKRCKPNKLTIFDEREDRNSFKSLLSFSS